MAEKKVLGQSGTWKGEDIVRICLDQAACPRFIVTKLYQCLISESVPPAEELTTPLAERFRATRLALNDLTDRLLSIGDPDFQLNKFFSQPRPAN